MTLAKEPEVHSTFTDEGFAAPRATFGLHPSLTWQAQPKLIGWRSTIHEIRALVLTITVQAFVTNVTTMPSADFCYAVNCLTAVSVVIPRHATDLPR